MADQSDKEQLEEVRAWWAENGSYIIGGIIVGVVIMVGWNRWQASIANEEIAASALFEDVMEAAARGNLDKATAAAEPLFSDYERSPYAAEARLALASLYMDNGRDQDAADVLQAQVDSDPDDEITLVARLRLAKILLYQDKAEQVVALIKDMPESAFSARFNEVLGDAYAALQSWSEAEAAYISALNDNPQVPTVDSRLIQLKLNDLPATDAASVVPDAPHEPGIADAADEGGSGNE